MNQIKCNHCGIKNDSRRINCQNCGDKILDQKKQTILRKYSNINKSGICFIIFGLSGLVNLIILNNISSKTVSGNYSDIENLMNLSKFFGILSLISVLIGGYFLITYKNDK